MYIDLIGLENFQYTTKSPSCAFVEAVGGEEKLFIKGNVPLEKMMYAMAYQKYGHYCYYCGKSLDKKTRSIDHKIPLNFGGISILPNLVPSCKDCNEEKSNLTDVEYQYWKNLTDYEEQRRYRLKCLGNHEKEKILRGTCLPQEWFEHKTTKIFVDISVEDSIKGKRYNTAEENLLKYGHFDKPIVVSDNGILLDGFITMWLAKNEGISDPPILKLKNFIVL